MKKNLKVYDGIEFDSKEERDFYMWLLESRSIGVIDNILVHDRTFSLFPTVKKKVAEFMKTTSKTKDRTLLNKAEYTPDFIFTFGKEFRSVVYENHNSIFLRQDPIFIGNRTRYMPDFCIVDVKPGVADHLLKYGSNRMLSMQQKIMYNVYRLFVQKVVPSDLFEKTFWPNQVLIGMTDLMRKRRKNKKTAKQWLEEELENSKFDYEKTKKLVDNFDNI